MRMCPAFQHCWTLQYRSYADVFDSVEHGAVKVVAVNDPFIEPHYAVWLALPWLPAFAMHTSRLTPLLGLYVEI